MIDIQRIVCPVDFSECSRRALDLSVAIARWYEARISVVHVYSVAVAPAAFAPGAAVVVEPLAMSALDRDLMMRELTEFAFASSDAAAVPMDLHLAEGTAWREIVARAAAVHADLLVLGAHGRSGFERFLLGSVSEKVLRTAPCPVVTVPLATRERFPVQPSELKRILFATDFSPAARAAQCWAESIASETDAELTVLHVVEALFTEVEGFPRSTLAVFRREYEEWSAQQLHDAIPDAVRARCTVREAISAGNPHREILRVAADRDAELIVLGVAGQRGLGDRVFGSTTQHVVRAAQCPVLTVREVTPFGVHT